MSNIVQNGGGHWGSMRWREHGSICRGSKRWEPEKTGVGLWMVAQRSRRRPAGAAKDSLDNRQDSVGMKLATDQGEFAGRTDYLHPKQPRGNTVGANRSNSQGSRFKALEDEMEIETETTAEEEGVEADNGGSPADRVNPCKGEQGIRSFNIAVSHAGLTGNLRPLKVQKLMFVFRPMEELRAQGKQPTKRRRI